MIKFETAKRHLLFRAIAIFLPFCIVLWACEKDDICVEGNTPNLIITFIDDVEGEMKEVSGFSLVEQETDLQIIGTSTTDSISIPLRLDTMGMDFVFIKNTGAAETADNPENRDTLSIKYVVEEKFISRACGFVGNFTSLDTVRNISTDDWIKKINILQTEVRNNNNIHLQIVH